MIGLLYDSLIKTHTLTQNHSLQLANIILVHPKCKIIFSALLVFYPLYFQYCVINHKKKQRNYTKNQAKMIKSDNFTKAKGRSPILLTK